MPVKSKGLLSRPNFYVSEYLERHRDEYYEQLLAVSRDGDWTGWSEFFFRALIAQAEANRAKAQEILALYGARKDWIANVTRSQYAVRALDWIFARPIFKTTDFVATAGIPPGDRYPHPSRRARRRNASGASPARRPAVLAFPELLNIAEGHAAF